jgi:carboxylesterase type B
MVETNTAPGTDPAIVQTHAGLVRGEGGPVTVFRGIPFAAPPVGALRWRPPAPVPAWEGIRDARRFGDDCPQKSSPINADSRASGRSEDCLTLNIWTPKTGAAARLPVMVWIYGGSFVFGTASERRVDGTPFARKGVVLVTIAYRTGVFGYLAHPELSAESPEGVSGNYGLLDQIAALRWVRENIAGFGGDPGNVTVFGVSAGSASIALMMTSPLAQGLFDRAILESPGAFRPLASLAEAEATGSLLGDDLAALRRLSPDELLSREHLLVPAMRRLTAARVLRPIRDGHVIRDDDRAAFNGGRFAAVPMIVGTNSDEGTWLTASWPVHTVADWEKVLRDNFAAETLDAVRQLYPVASDADVPRALADLFSDTQFNYGVWGVANASSRRQNLTFRYLFSRRRPNARTGPNHSDEVYYVFDNLDVPPRGMTESVFDTTDEAIAGMMQDAWIRFAATGDPNGGSLPRWPAYDAATDPVMEFGDAPRAREGWRRAHVAFLDVIYQ